MVLYGFFVSALYGFLFSANSAAAFSSQSMLVSLGRISSYFYSPFLCMRTKLYILLTLLPIGSIGLIIVEVYVAVKRGQTEEETHVISNERTDNKTAVQSEGR